MVKVAIFKKTLNNSYFNFIRKSKIAKIGLYFGFGSAFLGEKQCNKFQ